MTVTFRASISYQFEIHEFNYHLRCRLESSLYTLARGSSLQLSEFRWSTLLEPSEKLRKQTRHRLQEIADKEEE